MGKFELLPRYDMIERRPIPFGILAFKVDLLSDGERTVRIEDKLCWKKHKCAMNSCLVSGSRKF